MQKLCAALLALALLFSFCACEKKAPLDAALDKTAHYYKDTEISLGSDSLAPCFARSGRGGWQESYRDSVRESLEASGGTLDGAYATDYARTILALTAAGYDASDIGGYDLIAALGDLAFVCKQGYNGAIFALLALDCGGYTPVGGTASREALISAILENELPGGGFCYSGDAPDPDMTAMVLQALAPYQDNEAVATASARALSVLSAMQEADGSFVSWEVKGCESSAQVLLALCTLGISPEDPRFVKEGNGVLDALLRYQNRDGSFSHLAGGSPDTTATIQAYTALLALQMQERGEGRFYDFTEETTP